MDTMATVISDHQQSEQCGSYTLSADVSESESSNSTFSCQRYDVDGASSSMPPSPRPSTGADFPVAMYPPLLLPVIGGKDVVVWDEKPENRDRELSEIDLMKERFAKLLLGEDMSGGGKGVCTALAISNAITNLSATVFGEIWRLEQLAPQKKAMWCREMQWFLSVSDSIVELVPSTQQVSGGGTYEVMTPRPRSDLYMNLPALKKLDAMLISILDGFKNTEFWYVDNSIILADGDDNDVTSSSGSGGRPSIRQEEKWWLPCPKVPLRGLPEDTRKRLQQCRDCTNQILKAALAINSNVLAEMEIPSPYLMALPKSGRACLGDMAYRQITTDQFSAESVLECLDLSSEHSTLEAVNRIEAALQVWKLKAKKKDLNNSKTRLPSWGGKVMGLVADVEKNHFLVERAETLLHTLRLRFPSLPQTALEMNKIQYNKDVGQSILESYSRVMESLAFNIIARIDDVLYVDDSTKLTSAESVPLFSRGGLGGLPIQKRMSPSPFSIQHTPYISPFATPTLCSSTPVMCSPGRAPKLELPLPADFEKFLSYAGSTSARHASGDAPERD